MTDVCDFHFSFKFRRNIWGIVWLTDWWSTKIIILWCDAGVTLLSKWSSNWFWPVHATEGSVTGWPCSYIVQQTWPCTVYFEGVAVVECLERNLKTGMNAISLDPLYIVCWTTYTPHIIQLYVSMHWSINFILILTFLSTINHGLDGCFPIIYTIGNQSDINIVYKIHLLD